MTYDWSGAARGNRAPRIPNGVHRVTVAKVMREMKGKALETRDGDPQLLVVLADDQGREARLYCTLTPRDGWMLARLLGACGINLNAVKAEGYTPESFADERLATRTLIEKTRHLWVRVYQKEGKTYPDARPLLPDEVDDEHAKAAAVTRATAEAMGADDEVPF